MDAREIEEKIKSRKECLEPEHICQFGPATIADIKKDIELLELALIGLAVKSPGFARIETEDEFKARVRGQKD